MPAAEIYGKSSSPVIIKHKTGDIVLTPAENLDYIYKFSDTQSSHYVEGESLDIESAGQTLTLLFPDLTPVNPGCVGTFDVAASIASFSLNPSNTSLVSGRNYSISLDWVNCQSERATASNVQILAFELDGQTYDADFEGIDGVSNNYTFQLPLGVASGSGRFIWGDKADPDNDVCILHFDVVPGTVVDSESRHLEILNQTQPSTGMPSRTGHGQRVTGGTNVIEVDTVPELLSALTVEGNCIFASPALTNAQALINGSAPVRPAANVSLTTRNAPGFEFRRTVEGTMFLLDGRDNIILDGPRFSGAENISTSNNGGVTCIICNDGENYWFNKLSFAIPENDSISLGSGNSAHRLRRVTVSNIHWESKSSGSTIMSVYPDAANSGIYGEMTFHSNWHDANTGRTLLGDAGKDIHMFDQLVDNVRFDKIQLRNAQNLPVNGGTIFKILVESVHYHRTTNTNLLPLLRVTNDAAGNNTGIYYDDIRTTGFAELIEQNGNQNYIVPKSSSLNGGPDLPFYNYTTLGSLNVRTGVESHAGGY